MITTIQGSVLEDSGTAQEMLTKVPGMTGSEDGLEVLGKGSPIIYINGRLMRDDSELRRLRSDDILQHSGMNEYSDMGYYPIQQNNVFSTHKFQVSVLYRLNSTRSKYKGTGAGKDAQEKMKS